jgi:predicted P-loop ATPase
MEADVATKTTNPNRETIARVFNTYLDQPRWVSWETRNEEKVPLVGGTKRLAKTNDPKTWRTLAQCPGERRGLVLNGGNLGGVDLDGCRDPKTGALVPWAEEVVKDFGSYTEISPSETGLKIFAYGAPDALTNNVLAMPGKPINGKAPQIEAYITGRYFAVTGEHLAGTPMEIRATPEAWARLAQRLDEQPAVGNKKAAGRNPALFRFGCQQRRRGKSNDEVAEAIRAENRKGNVELHEHFAEGPLKEHEVATIIRSVLKQSPFPDVTKKGGLRPTLPNTKVALGQLGVECRHDLFKLRYLVNGLELENFVGDVSDPALLRLREVIYERFGFDPNTETVHTAVMTLANHRRFHPVCDYLDGLQWDGVPRIDCWLITYGGAKDSEYLRAVGALVLVAAVRRVRSPGCKFDEMLVLENPEQGTNKSSAVQVLAVKPEWFSDNLPLGLPPKETIEALSGHWIMEVSELQGMRKSDIEKVKAFLSRQTDRARMAYGRTTTEACRQCVIIGTTNSNKYLPDLTGNRRIWPVRVERFDLDALKRDRDQLWAEAAAREASGASIRLPEELWAAAAAEQEERVVDNPFLSVLDRALREVEILEPEVRDDKGKTLKPAKRAPGQPMSGKIAAEDVWTLLGIRPGQRHQDHNEKLGAAMAKLGWKRTRLRIEGELSYSYVRGEEPYRRIVVFPEDKGYPATASYENTEAPAF